MKHILNIRINILLKLILLLSALSTMQSCVVYQLYPISTRVPVEDSVQKFTVHADLLTIGTQLSADYQINKHIKVGMRGMFKMIGGIEPLGSDGFNTKFSSSVTHGFQCISSYAKEIKPQKHLSCIAGFQRQNNESSLPKLVPDKPGIRSVPTYPLVHNACQLGFGFVNQKSKIHFKYYAGIYQTYYRYDTYNLNNNNYLSQKYFSGYTLVQFGFEMQHKRTSFFTVSNYSLNYKYVAPAPILHFGISHKILNIKKE